MSKQWVDQRPSMEVRLNLVTINRRVAKANGDAVQCSVCGEHFMKDEIVGNEGVLMCKECIEKGQCELCNEYFKKDDLHIMENANGDIVHERVCDKCESNILSDDEPVATVIYGDDDEPCFISEYNNGTDGAFKAFWRSTDAWRGYYEVTPSDKWVLVHDDCVLAYSEDAFELEKFDEEFRKALSGLGIRFARVFARTSNVFSQGYDFFVAKERAFEANAIRVVLALRYRDPERLNSTVLTGADPDEQTDDDKLFVKAAGLLKQGLTPEEAVEKVMEEKQ